MDPPEFEARAGTASADFRASPRIQTAAKGQVPMANRQAVYGRFTFLTKLGHPAFAVHFALAPRDAAGNLPPQAGLRAGLVAFA